MTDLNALLERVRAATGPDRELDCLIWQTAEPDRRVMMDQGKAFGPGPKRPASYGRLADFPMEKWDDWEAIGGWIDAPRLTASIDAALALVERMGLTPHVLHHGRIVWDAGLIVSDHAETEWEGRHNSLPLAILSALLSALIAKEAA